MKHRLYVDEVGNPGLETSVDERHRFLSLTGVVVELSYVDSVVVPTIESLKREFFQYHPDDPPVLHRKELVNKRPPFAELRDPNVEREFNKRFLDVIASRSVVTLSYSRLSEFTIVMGDLERKRTPA